LRWTVWHGGTEPFAPPGVNLLIVVCFASLRAGWFLKQRLLATRTKHYVVSEEDEWTVGASEEIQARSSLTIRKFPQLTF
jgi:hypothetical protein